MSNVLLNCHWCNCEFEIRKAEYSRQVRNGRSHFFCGRSCSASYGNEISGKKKRKIEKSCPACGGEFSTETGAKSAIFCSRSCASSGSVTEKRRDKAKRVGGVNLRNDLNHSAKCLLSRESWKYEKIRRLLDLLEEDYEFEFVVGDGIFDLALKGRKILVEFDSRYHNFSSQMERDKEKDFQAKSFGWTIERIGVGSNEEIKASAIRHLI